MGYLAVIGTTFVGVLVLTAVVFATLMNALVGRVGNEALVAAILIAFLAAKAVGDRYEEPDAPR